uniref:prostaglandin E2 receptor EP3 subtype-like n=1 Tax=Pristiophorus japonicus TaxID=55135 RepID=UPI00398EBCCA
MEAIENAPRPQNSEVSAIYRNNSSASTLPSNMSSASKEPKSVSVLYPVIMMTIGIVTNLLALMLAYRSYHQKENMRKKSFVLIIGAQALTNLTGELLISPIVIAVYLTHRQWGHVDPSGNLCTFFGVCITTFGLWPLFFSSAMAVQWTLAIHAPQYYSNHITIRFTKLLVMSIWVGVLIFALLPVFGFGRYTVQWPGTWCFINTGGRSLSNTIYALIFVVLGISSLLVTLSSNVATIRGLLVCSKNKISSTNKQWERITLEVLFQLMGIMCVVYVCWSTVLMLLLIKIVTKSSSEYCYTSPTNPSPLSPELQNECNIFLTGIRLAAFNQIFEPWVYLLLRESMLRKVCQLTNAATMCLGEEVNEIPVTAEESADLKEQII